MANFQKKTNLTKDTLRYYDKIGLLHTKYNGKNRGYEELYEYFKTYGMEFFEYMGLSKEKLRFHDHEKLAHYAKAACDIEYLFPFGWGEINGTHNRTDFDLRRHQEFCGKSLMYFDQEKEEKYIPYVVESTYGLDRLILAILFESLVEEELENQETRNVLKIPAFLAPIKVNVLPLIKKRHGEKAQEIYRQLQRFCMASYDDAGKIGRRYRRGDAIGTPYAVTIDDETLENGLVTMRERDSMEQITLSVPEIKNYLMARILLP